MMFNAKAMSRKFLAFLLALGLVSCVTVNVHFPEGAVQKAADDYVKELYRIKETEQKDEQKKSSSLIPGQIFQVASLSLLPVAHAAPEMKVDSAKAKKILQSQAGRLGKIDKYKAKGVLGETAKGLLMVKDRKPLKKLENKMIDKLVKSENDDREALYKEVMNHNNIGSGQKPQVIKSFSNSFIQNSPKGTWVEKDGAWSQK